MDRQPAGTEVGGLYAKGLGAGAAENIRKENSDASITDLRYDDTVRLAKQRAEQPNCVLVQDTSWDGYTEVPSWILQGYTTMANEVREELESQQLLAPTHIFLQAGVGSMPAALAGYFTNIYAQHKPIITVVEPTRPTASSAPPGPRMAGCTLSPRR